MNPVILYANILEDGSLTATDTATGYDVNNLLDYRPYTWHQFSASGTKYYTVDAGSGNTLTADALGICGHNLYTAAATVSVESSPDASTWTERLSGFTVTTDRAILKTFTSASARYWRIKIVTSSVTAKCAVVILGARITFPGGLQPGSNVENSAIVADTAYSKNGQYLGAVVRYHQIKESYKILPAAGDYTWYSTAYQTFWDNHGKLLMPFFFGLNLSQFPANVFYGALQKDAAMVMPVKLYDHLDGFTLDIEGPKEP